MQENIIQSVQEADSTIRKVKPDGFTLFLIQCLGKNQVGLEPSGSWVGLLF